MDKNLNSRQDSRNFNSGAPLAEEASVNDDFPCQAEVDDDEHECADDFELDQASVDKISRQIDDCPTLRNLIDADGDVRNLSAFGYLSWNAMTQLDTHIRAKYKHFSDNHPEQGFALNVAWQSERGSDTKEDAADENQ